MSKIHDAVAIAIQARKPALLWGEPGTGKTAWVNQLAEKMGVPIEAIIASIREPSDFGGLPIITPSGEVVLAPPAWAKRLIEAGEGILFIDEATTAPPAVQASLLRVIHEGVVGEVALPEKVARIAAANPPEQAAGGWSLSPPLANRFVHLDWPHDSEEWANGIIDGWNTSYDIPVLPDDWTDNIPASAALVSAYIHTRPEKLLHVPKTEAEAGKAWPSGRTWHMGSELLAAIEAVSPGDEELQVYLLSGCVGDGAAQEFLVWTRDLDLQNPEELLKDPKSYKHPDRPDKVYATLSSVVAAVVNNLTEDRWVSAWKVLATAGKKGTPDIAAFAAKTLTKYTKDDFNFAEIIKEVNMFTPILKEANLV